MKEKTKANLSAAFAGESQAHLRYMVYAEMAEREGRSNVARLFRAASHSEQIHAANHQTVLEKMGQKPDPVKPEVTVKNTIENLEDAIKGETHEMLTMYPEFIATAKAEEAAPATKSLRWAMETEKKHQVMYQNALTALNSKKADALPKTYWVCPKCGNTYNQAKPEASCSFCSTKSDKYLKFGK